MTEQDDYSRVFDTLLDALPAEFSLAQAEALLPKAELAERLVRELETDGRFFDDGAGRYLRRAALFRGGEFLLTPTELEKTEKILIPGHRFAPFFSDDVFPSEVTLLDMAGKLVPMREYTAPLLELFPYALLLGSEQIFDYLVADHPENVKLRHAARGTELVKIRVFDASALYEMLDFTAGDTLLATVMDVEKGVVQLQKMPGARRNSSAIDAWCESLGNALERTIERFENYQEIPEQLAWSYYFGGKALLHRPMASLDDFLRLSTRFEIALEGGHTALAPRVQEQDESMDFSVPEGMGISSGSTDDLQKMFTELGLTLTETELDSMMLDSAYQREDGFGAFFRRCFAEPLSYADAAQEAVFLNFLEARYEELTGVYDRVADEPVSELRAAILELLDLKNTFLRQTTETPPEKPLAELASVTLGLNELLRMLNDPRRESSPEDIENAAEAVADLAARQEEALEALELGMDHAGMKEQTPARAAGNRKPRKPRRNHS